VSLKGAYEDSRNVFLVMEARSARRKRPAGRPPHS
jgi:hypothetical protein